MWYRQQPMKHVRLSAATSSAADSLTWGVRAHTKDVDLCIWHFAQELMLGV